MADFLFNMIGTVGVALIVLAYFLLEHGKLKSDQMLYPLMNLVGALLLLVSLYWTPNIPSIIIEIIWVSISIYGIMKILGKKT